MKINCDTQKKKFFFFWVCFLFFFCLLVILNNVIQSCTCTLLQMSVYSVKHLGTRNKISESNNFAIVPRRFTLTASLRRTE